MKVSISPLMLQSLKVLSIFLDFCMLNAYLIQLDSWLDSPQKILVILWQSSPSESGGRGNRESCPQLHTQYDSDLCGGVSKCCVKGSCLHHDDIIQGFNLPTVDVLYLFPNEQRTDCRYYKYSMQLLNKPKWL